MRTRPEQDKLGSLGDKAHDVIDDNKEQITSQLREKKDELLDKAGAALQPSSEPEESAPSQSQGAEPSFMASR